MKYIIPGPDGTFQLHPDVQGEDKRIILQLAKEVVPELNLFMVKAADMIFSMAAPYLPAASVRKDNGAFGQYGYELQITTTSNDPRMQMFQVRFQVHYRQFTMIRDVLSSFTLVVKSDDRVKELSSGYPIASNEQTKPLVWGDLVPVGQLTFELKP